MASQVYNKFVGFLIVLGLYITFVLISALFESGGGDLSRKNETLNSTPPNDKPSTTSKDFSNSWDIDFNGQGIDPESYWGQLRNRIFTMYNNKCAKCGINKNLTVHHKIELSLGGSNTLDNLELLCRNCHEAIHEHSIFDDLRYFGGNDNYGKNPKLSRKVSVIADAIRNSKDLIIDYIDRYDKRTHRTITPKNLFREHNRIYVRTFCHLRKDDRTFRVSRLTLN